MSKGKILFVTRYHHLRYTGGAELQCWMLATELVRRGWEAHYVSENNRPDAPTELDGVKLHYLPEGPPWHDCNRAGIERVMRELEPDVIYNRVFNLYTAHAMAFAPAKAVTIWAAAAANDGTVFGLFGDLWKNKPLPQFLAMLPQAFYSRTKARQGALSAKLQLAQSSLQAERLMAHGYQPVLLRNSIRIENEPAQSHDGPPVVLWVGSVKKHKRPELFYELARRCADLDCEFVMAGELQDEFSREPLARAQAELKKFKYLGFVPPEQIGEHFSRAHLLVSTSHAEGFPNTFIQAWLRGVPVLSLDVDPDRLLSVEKLGTVANSLNELESSLRDLLGDVGLRREMGARAREFTFKEFDLRQNVDRLENLIGERQSH